MLTPRIVRVLDLTEEDLRAFQMGRDSSSAGSAPGGRLGVPAGGIELPLPDEPQIRPSEPDADQPRRRRDAASAAGDAAAATAADAAQPRASTAALDMLPVLPPIVARACAHGTGVAIRDRDGHVTPTTSSIAPPQSSRPDFSTAVDDLNEARVAFLVTPGFDYVAVQWGIWRAGGIAVPLPMSHPPAELEYLVRDSEASIVIADADNEAVVEPLAQTRREQRSSLRRPT